MLLQDLLEVVVQLVDAEGEEVAAGPSALLADWRCCLLGGVVVQLVEVAEGIEVAAGPSAFIADWRRYQSLLDGLVERP